MIAALSKGENAEIARACIKKLEKLTMRAGRKVQELDKEDVLHANKKKAEKKKQEQRALQIKEELRKQRLNRMIREQGYLLEKDGLIPSSKTKNPNKLNPEDPALRLDTATEMAIAMQAEVIAALEAGEVASVSADVAGAEASGEVAAAAAEAPAAEGGAEAAPAE